MKGRRLTMSHARYAAALARVTRPLVRGRTMSIRLDAIRSAAIRLLALNTGQTEEDIIRRALDEYLVRRGHGGAVERASRRGQ